jgi:hypothetical protein
MPPSYDATDAALVWVSCLTCVTRALRCADALRLQPAEREAGAHDGLPRQRAYRPLPPPPQERPRHLRLRFRPQALAPLTRPVEASPAPLTPPAPQTPCTPPCPFAASDARCVPCHAGGASGRGGRAHSPHAMPGITFAMLGVADAHHQSAWPSSPFVVLGLSLYTLPSLTPDGLHAVGRQLERVKGERTARAKMRKDGKSEKVRTERAKR